jgi:hypothetical protein
MKDGGETGAATLLGSKAENYTFAISRLTQKRFERDALPRGIAACASLFA